MEIALKIDVDTHRGLGEGVPRLARLLTAEGITASFFIAMGPDNSGRAITRVIKNRGFLSKMRRTSALSMYGWRTALSGTLLPCRPIALAFPQVIRDLVRAGFEVGVHGYDHVRWQDQIDSLGEQTISREIDDAMEVCRAIIGVAARSFAAPGWRTNSTALKILDRRALDYRSDTRGRTPYRCEVEGKVLDHPEIPTTLPTLDEVIGSHGLPSDEAMVRFYLDRFSPESLNVHTIHAETEGLGQLGVFTTMIRALKQVGARFVGLHEIATSLATAELPVCEVVRTTLPGRAGWISAQGPEKSV